MNLLPYLPAAELGSCPEERRWLIENLWADQAVGVVPRREGGGVNDLVAVHLMNGHELVIRDADRCADTPAVLGDVLEVVTHVKGQIEFVIGCRAHATEPVRDKGVDAEWCYDVDRIDAK